MEDEKQKEEANKKRKTYPELPSNQALDSSNSLHSALCQNLVIELEDLGKQKESETTFICHKFGV